MKGLLKRAELALSNFQFRRWQKKNPGASFKDYFAAGVTEGLTSGKPRASLGETLKKGEFGELGRKTFDALRRNYGLRPEDVCVDYGCGTLRMGVHAINYLDPGLYWGLDVDQALLDEGARLVGQEVMEARRPHLGVISAATVRQAADAKPALLFSLKVLIHVHPDELHEYFGNILTIIGGGGKGVITGRWNSGPTLQTSSKSWAHSLGILNEVVAAKGGSLVVVEEKDYAVEDLGKIAKAGTLAIKKRPL